MKSRRLINACIIISALVLLPMSRCDDRADEVRKLIRGQWNLVEQTENGEKKNYIMKVEYAKGGRALLIQYNKRNKEIYRSSARWKVDDNGNYVIWYNDRDTADQKWKLISLTKTDCIMEMRIKIKTENWITRRHLGR